MPTIFIATSVEALERTQPLSFAGPRALEKISGERIINSFAFLTLVCAELVIAQSVTVVAREREKAAAKRTKQSIKHDMFEKKIRQGKRKIKHLTCSQVVDHQREDTRRSMVLIFSLSVSFLPGTQHVITSGGVEQGTS